HTAQSARVAEIARPPPSELASAVACPLHRFGACSNAIFAAPPHAPPTAPHSFPTRRSSDLYALRLRHWSPARSRCCGSKSYRRYTLPAHLIGEYATVEGLDRHARHVFSAPLH